VRRDRWRDLGPDGMTVNLNDVDCRNFKRFELD